MSGAFLLAQSPIVFTNLGVNIFSYLLCWISVSWAHILFSYMDGCVWAWSGPPSTLPNIWRLWQCLPVGGFEDKHSKNLQEEHQLELSFQDKRLRPSIAVPLSSFKKMVYLFLSLAVLSLRCCTQAFSSCGKRGFCVLWCVGFSLRWLLLLRSTGSRAHGSAVVAHGL